MGDAGGVGSSGGSGSSTQDCDAEEYVNTVMSSQPAAAVALTPLPSGRKRSLSASDMTSLSETDVKKHKGDAEGRQLAKARRNLMQSSGDEVIIVESPAKEPETTVEPSKSGKESEKQVDKGKLPAKNKKGNGGKNNGKKSGMNQEDNSGDTSKPSASVPSTSAQCDADSDVKALLKKLSEDMQSMHSMLNKKIDMIENKIEQSEKRITDKVTDKVTKIIDKRVNGESAKLRKEIDTRLSAMRDDFTAELNELSERLEQGTRNTPSNDEDIQLRVVVCNLPESARENVKDRVNAVIKDGLKIRDITVVSAERKESRVQSKPGIIIAKFRDSDDKRKVMMAKTMLKDNRQYRDIYINHDQTREERTLANNMRTLVNGVKRGQNFHIRGNRIVTAPGRNDNGFRSENRRNYGQRDRDGTSDRARANESRNRHNDRENTRSDTRTVTRDRANERRHPESYNPRHERSAPENRYTSRRQTGGRY